tara:strand:+ start:206 stop:427 length:222 start_codon:yes stop_codon:yes gene_type:complete
MSAEGKILNKLVTVLATILVLSPVYASKNILTQEKTSKKTAIFMNKFEKTYETKEFNQFKADFFEKFEKVSKK